MATSLWYLKVNCIPKQEFLTREKKLARLLFDFGVVNTTDDDCNQQVPSVALRLQVDITIGETTVVFGLQQLWSDAMSNSWL